MDARIEKYIADRIEYISGSAYGHMGNEPLFPADIGLTDEQELSIKSSIGRAHGSAWARYKRNDARARFIRATQVSCETRARREHHPIDLGDVYAVAYKIAYGQLDLVCRPN